MAFLAAVPALMASAGSAMGFGAAAGGAAAGAGAAASSAISATALASGLSAAGSLVGGISQFAQGNYQAAVAKNNATILDQQANATRQIGQAQESQQRMKVGQLVGQQTAAQGANGVDVNYGSPAAVRDATRIEGDYDADIIRYNAAKQAWGQNVEALNMRSQASMAKRAGIFGLASSFLGAASSLAGGAAKIGSMKAAQDMWGAGGSGASGGWTGLSGSYATDWG